MKDVKQNGNNVTSAGADGKQGAVQSVPPLDPAADLARIVKESRNFQPDNVTINEDLLLQKLTSFVVRYGHAAWNDGYAKGKGDCSN